MDELRELLGDSTVLDEILQMLSYDDEKYYVREIKRAFDID